MEKEYKYDVAISFAEKDRDAAKSLSLAFQLLGINAYYYPDDRIATLGSNLEIKLTEIYTDEAKYAVVLLSENYFHEEKIYTGIELSAIQNRMQKDAGTVYMIPVKLDKNFSLKKYPDLNTLTYADWDCKPELIAADINKLLGKKLVSPTDATDGNSVVYSSGVNPLVIIDDEISTINLDTLRKVGGGQVVLINKDAEEFKFSKLKKNYYPCPFCLLEQVFEKYGKNSCTSCKAEYIIPNTEFKVLTHFTLNETETKEYNKIRARITNSILDKDYNTALKLSMQAEKIAPAEPSTWEHFALTQFLIEIYAEAKERVSSKQIVKKIRPHLEKCKKHGISDERLDDLLIEIANKLFSIEKARIGSLKPAYTDQFGNDIWTRYNLIKIKDYLNSFELCYSLSENILFLKEYVKELSKPYKWLIKRGDGEIHNTRSCGNFRASDKYNLLVAKIREKEMDYEAPDIPEEIFRILSNEVRSDEQDILVGEETTNETPDSFKIISIS